MSDEKVVYIPAQSSTTYHDRVVIDGDSLPACDKQYKETNRDWKVADRDDVPYRFTPCKKCHGSQRTCIRTPEEITDLLGVDELPENIYSDPDALRVLMDAKTDVQSIADAFGVSRTTIYKHLRRYDIETHYSEIAEQRAKSREIHRLLEAADPDDLTTPTPDGDETWRDYYQDSTGSEV